jgi:hypothetical protein
MYNQTIKAYCDKYYEKNRERLNAYHNEKNKQRFKNKYQNDSEFREEYKNKMKEERKNKYHTDPEFKKMVNDKRKALYHKKKLEKLENIDINLPVTYL